jgi:putative cell wall-binding protein
MVVTATFSDPSVKKLFGTDTLPTPFDVLNAECLQTIQRLNPDCKVICEGAMAVERTK